MLNDLDETIKRVLLRAEGLDPAQVDISFDIPNRDWSEKLGKRLTLNCYLFDIHERRLLREEGWAVEGRGTKESARRPPPLFFEITYLITAWTALVEDEHFLLWRALAALMDHSVLPDELLQGALQQHPWPIHTSVAQLEGVLKSPGEFWTALENQLKPSLSYTVLLGRERQPRPTGAPPVLGTGLRLRLPEPGPGGSFRLGAIFRVPPGADLAIKVAARPIDPASGEAGPVAATASANSDGYFSLSLSPGRYMLEATLGGEPMRRTIVVPDPATSAASRRFSDVVRDQAGSPLPGVLIEVEGLGLRTVSDGAGVFSLDLPPGRHTLRLHLDGYFEQRRVVVRETGYTLTLGLGGRPPDPA